MTNPTKNPNPPFPIILALLIITALAIETLAAIPSIINSDIPAVTAITDGLFAAFGISPNPSITREFVFFGAAVYALKAIALIAIAICAYLGQNWSRIAYTLFFLLTFAITLNHYEMFPNTVIPTCLSIASIILLFLPNSNRWFNPKSDT